MAGGDDQATAAPTAAAPPPPLPRAAAGAAAAAAADAVVDAGAALHPGGLQLAAMPGVARTMLDAVHDEQTASLHFWDQEGSKSMRRRLPYTHGFGNAVRFTKIAEGEF